MPMPAKRRVLRLDQSLSGLGKPRRMRGGFLRVDSRFTKPGVFPYEENGRTIMEYRPSSEVFAEKSIDSWKGVPLTDGHPADLVDSDSWRKDGVRVVGVVGDNVRELDGALATTETIHDSRAVRLTTAGQRPERSGGYWAELDDTPGETSGDPNVPDGIRYDRVQRQIEGNHVAILPKGHARLGPDMTMRLDSRGNQTVRVLRTDSEKSMKITFNGKTYDLDDPGDRALLNAAVDADTAERKTRTDAVSAVTRERDELKGRVDALEAEAKKLPEKVAAGVAERLVLEREGAAVLGEKFDSKLADEALKKAIRDGMEVAIKAADPSAKLEGEPDAYVRGRYAGLRADAARVEKSRSDFRRSVDDVTRRAPPSQEGDLELGGLMDRANEAQRRFDNAQGDSK